MNCVSLTTEISVKYLTFCNQRSRNASLICVYKKRRNEDCVNETVRPDPRFSTMTRASHASTLFLLSLLGIAFATKQSAELTSLFAPDPKGVVPRKVCINIGSWFQTVGPFVAELGLVKYTGGEPGAFTVPSRPIGKTVHDHAFVTQRTLKNINFKVIVQKRAKYVVTLGFAEVQHRFCRKGKRVLDLSVQSLKKTGVDVFDAAGCNKAYFVQFKNVRPSRTGMINIGVKGRRGAAVLAALCVQRVGRGTGSGPGTSPRPRPSRSVRPSPRPSRRPRPSRTPPRPSVAPPASRSPRPSPAPSTSPRPVPTLSLSPCQESGCVNFEGPGDYVVVGASMSVDEDRSNCAILSSSTASLSVPAGAKVKSALLYWSASGFISKTAQVQLNGNTVTAGRMYRGGSSGFHFYGSATDVTSLVSGSGSYTVSGIWYDNGNPYCNANAAYAAWTMVVVYERADLPRAQINVCFDDFTFTYPAGTYTSNVGCVAGNSGTRNARTTVVSFESDAYKGEDFLISGQPRGNGLFRGSTAPNLDILSFDVLGLVQSGVSSISYTFRTYVTNTVFGRAIEGLFLPIRVVYYTKHYK